MQSRGGVALFDPLEKTLLVKATSKNCLKGKSLSRLLLKACFKGKPREDEDDEAQDQDQDQDEEDEDDEDGEDDEYGQFEEDVDDEAGG